MCSVHVIPSAEVALIVEPIVVLDSTAQNNPSSGDHATDIQSRTVAEIVCSVHVMPSGDVAHVVEPDETAQRTPSSGDHATSRQVLLVDDIKCSTAV